MNTVLLRGVVGSHAYSMARPDSDIDVLGCYAAPTIQFHGLTPPTGKHATQHTTSPDVTLHEAGKFAGLCLGGNPTAMELLWLDTYQVRTELGDQLVSIREKFLSAPRVRDAYLGYATQQFRRLSNSGRFPDVPVARIEKHARHLLRLVEQGTHLWVTGKLELKVPDPQRVFDFGTRVGAGDIEAAEWVIKRAEETFQTCATVLPAAPDRAAVQGWLHDVRAAHYFRGPATPEPKPVPPTVDARLTPYTPPANAPRVVLCDIDGTVALRGDRSPYDESRVVDDQPNWPVIDTLLALEVANHQLVFLSGRSEKCRDDTETWLSRHVVWGPLELHMRTVGDTRPDTEVKLEMFNTHIRDRYDVRVVLDDRNSVVQLWRSLGLTCLQVADGDF